MRFGSRVRHPAAALHLGGLLRSKSGLIYLLRDLFTTDEASPLTSPRTCEPGPGTLTFTAPNNVAISGGALVPSGAFYGYGDFAVAKSPGYAVFCEWNTGAANIAMSLYLLSMSDKDGEPNSTGSAGFRRVSGAFDIYPYQSGTPSWAVRAYPTTGNTTYKLLLVARQDTTGWFWVVDGKLIYVSNLSASDLDDKNVVIGAVASYDISWDNLSALSLPANGYTAWDADFSTVTDTKTLAGGSSSDFNCAADCHVTGTFTEEAGKNIQVNIRYTDANNWVQFFKSNADNKVYLRSRLAGAVTTYTAGSALVNGTVYKYDITASGSTVSFWINNVLEDTQTIAAHVNVAQGNSAGNLATPDLTVNSHPYPALGIATDRVIAPQQGTTGTHDADCLIYLRGITLPSSSYCAVNVRYNSTDNDYLQILFRDDGTFKIDIYDNGVFSAALVNTAAGTVATGDDLCVTLDGADVRTYRANSALGSSSSTPYLSNTSFNVQRIVNGGSIDSIEFFPRDVTSLLPSELV